MRSALVSVALQRVVMVTQAKRQQLSEIVYISLGWLCPVHLKYFNAFSINEIAENYPNSSGVLSLFYQMNRPLVVPRRSAVVLKRRNEMAQRTPNPHTKKCNDAITINAKDHCNYVSAAMRF